MNTPTLPETFPSSRSAERRRYPRVALKLPVRLRWIGALGQTVLVTNALDISRGGILAPVEVGKRPEFQLYSPAWATCPNEADAKTPQPETPVRVARVVESLPGNVLLGLEFQIAADSAIAPPARERRTHPRSTLAVPLRVRWAGAPWYEETMTVNVSAGGVLFCARRLYALGDEVRLGLPRGIVRGALGSRNDIPARIVRRIDRRDCDYVAAAFAA